MNETIEELEKEKIKDDKEGDNAILDRNTEHVEETTTKEEENNEVN